METARRLGIYSLILAFLLFVFFDQTETSQLEWRNQLLAYGIIFAFLGLFLITRFRSRPERSSTRFSWIRNWLYKYKKNKKDNRMSIGSRQNNRSRSGRKNEEEEEESRRK